MSVPTKKQLRRTALISIAFASGMLNGQLTAKAEYKSEVNDLAIQQIATNMGIGPETRAFYLLKLANGYIADGATASLKSQFGSIRPDPSKDSRRVKTFLDIALVDWTNEISREKDKSFESIKQTSSKRKSVRSENLLLADLALANALKQLDYASERIAKLKMNFIALRLYQKTGNIDGMQKCNGLLKQAFMAAELTSPVDETEVKAASSVLNLFASCLIPVTIPNSNAGVFLERQTTVEPFTEEEFRESEKLRLRAIGMVDRLSSKNDIRRKAHRDLSIWYTKLGKVEMATKEKKVLFELVGIEDDSILYPQAAGCGHDVWWKKQGTVEAMGCGMG